MFTSSLSAEVHEFCQNERFHGACGRDEVVVMETAVYGRMRFSRCIERDYGYVVSTHSVLRILSTHPVLHSLSTHPVLHSLSTHPVLHSLSSHPVLKQS